MGKGWNYLGRACQSHPVYSSIPRVEMQQRALRLEEEKPEQVEELERALLVRKKPDKQRSKFGCL